MQLDILSFLTRMIINLHTNMAPSSTKTAPIKLAVLGALGMAFAWGVIAGSVGECLLVNIGNVKCPPTALPTRPQRTHQVQSREKSPEKVGSLAYSPHNQCRWYKPSIPIITSRIPNARFADVFHSGIVVTTVSALIALISFLFIAHLLLLPYDRITRTFRIQGGLLAFFAIWLFATLIPFTHFVATRSANVTATLNGVRLPASLVQRAEQALGSTSVYKKIGYCMVYSIPFSHISALIILFQCDWLQSFRGSRSFSPSLLRLCCSLLPRAVTTPQQVLSVPLLIPVKWWTRKMQTSRFSLVAW